MQEDYPAVPLLRTLAETEEKAIRKHGENNVEILLFSGMVIGCG